MKTSGNTQRGVDCEQLAIENAVSVRMQPMPRPVHFEIHAADPQRAIAFYTSLFDWKFAQWDGPMEYWMVTTGSSQWPEMTTSAFGGEDPTSSGTWRR